MKILFCSHEKFLPLVIGGSIGNLKLVEKMVERGHKVTAATPLYLDPKPIEKRYKIRLVPFSPFYIDRYIPYRERKYILYAFLYFFHLLKLFSLERYDAVLVRNCVLAVPALPFKHFFRLPFFLSMTDFLSGFSYQNPRVPRLLVDILFEVERWLACQFDRTFVITPGMKAELEKGPGSSSRLMVSYDGVDVDKFDLNKIDPAIIKRTREEMGFDKNIVLYHGTIQLDAVDLFEKIIQTTLNKAGVNFVLIGLGKGYSHLKQRLGENRQVRFMGFIEHDDLPRFMASSQVGIVPYKRTFNSNIILTLKMLEYLAMGLPVVSTDLAGIQEVFGGLAGVSIASDIESFSQKIIASLTLARSEEAIRFIRQNFSWEKVTTNIVEEIEKMVLTKNYEVNS